ncbi:MAG: ABC transporter ATP-binding protein, partial [Desertimonas sp.]
MSDPVLQVRGLRLEIAATGDDIVDEVDITLGPGEILGLVGESGSGKTTVGLSVLNHTRRGVVRRGGRVVIDGTELSELTGRRLRAARGTLVSYVPQDPGSALNPARRIGSMLREVLASHGFGDDDAARDHRRREVMRDVLLPDTDEFLRRYPHQLSGGQQQRVGLALAFACRPSVIVLDEPTTGLDVSTQLHVLDTVRRLAAEHSVAAVYVTHDLAVVANLADRVAVMYAGRVVEEGPTERLFANPAHPYTRALTAAAPDMDAERTIIGLGGRAPAPGRRPQGCAFATRCDLADQRCRNEFPAVEPAVATTAGVSGDAGSAERPPPPAGNHVVRCFRPFEIPERLAHPDPPPLVSVDVEQPVLSVRHVDAGYGGTTIVSDATFDIHRGECVALVGESGSGKSTLSRSIGGLHREWTGTVMLDGVELARSARQRSVEQRLQVQYVFQNPYSSLHPRRTIGESVARPLRIGGASAAEARTAVDRTLEQVSLTAAYAPKYPDQLSGGERQRVAIARALVSRPSVLVCDEVTSALDVLVQASIVDMLIDLQRELGLAMLFVTHNLPLVASLAQRVAVMSEGTIVELGPTA